jgi:hypothetical protein
MPEEKLTPSILYTTEAEESKKKAEEELNSPDPEEAIAVEIINKFKLEVDVIGEKEEKDSCSEGND